jgi:pimeloyl-ACP methyl ester carboxylesterase
MLEREQQVNLNYRVDGDGEPVWLLFNGATLPLGFWDPVAEALASSATVVRFDQRNAGATRARGTFSLLDTAADAAALLDHLGCDRVILLGHAWGGRVAQVFARDYPHRARAMVICGTGGQLPARVPEAVLQRLRNAGRSRDRTSWEIALAEAFCARGFSTREPERFEAIADLLWAQPPNTEARWDPEIAPSSSYWGQTALPALLLYGDQDLNGTPENAEDLLRRLPDARLVSIAGSGHFVVREAVDWVIDELTAFAANLED